MCESYEWCSDDDDPLAVALLRSPRPARLVVECSVQRHRLAAIYDIPDHGLTFCRPATTELASFAWGGPQAAFARQWKGGETVEGAPLEQVDKIHQHAERIPLAELAKQESGRDMSLRCRCGSFRLDAGSVARLALARSVAAVTATRER